MKITNEQVQKLTMNHSRLDDFLEVIIEDDFLEAIIEIFEIFPNYLYRIVLRSYILIREWQKELEQICAEAYAAELIPRKVKKWVRNKMIIALEFERRWNPRYEFKL